MNKAIISLMSTETFGESGLVNKSQNLTNVFHCFCFVFSMERPEPPVYYGSVNILICVYSFRLLKSATERVNGETKHATEWISMFWYVIPVKKIDFIPFQQVLEMFECRFLYFIENHVWFFIIIKNSTFFCVVFCLLCVMFVA